MPGGTDKPLLPSTFLKRIKNSKMRKTSPAPFSQRKKTGIQRDKKRGRGLRTGSWQNKGSALSMKRSKPWNVRTARLRPIVSYLSDLPEVYKAP